MSRLTETKPPRINFLCVGAQKSGTTSLHHILNQHKDICLPSCKETHFFDVDENYENGLAWYYATYFNHFSGENICGECTPEYMYFEEVPERIFNAFGPDLKLIFILRNPVNRAFSHYLMSKKRGHEKLSFKEAIDLEKERIQKDYHHKSHFSYLTRGLYSNQIKRYLNLFPEENFFFIRFEEDFVKNRRKTINDLCDFLGTSGDQLNVEIKSHVAKIPRYRLLPKFIYRPNTMVRLISFLPPSIKQKIVKLGYNFALKEVDSDKMSVKMKKTLMSKYESEISELELLIKKDLTTWKM